MFARTARRYCLYHQTDTKIICRLPAGYRTEEEETKYKRPIDSMVTIKAGSDTYANLLI